MTLCLGAEGQSRQLVAAPSTPVTPTQPNSQQVEGKALAMHKPGLLGVCKQGPAPQSYVGVG